jgi:hypothetical protein
MAEPEILSPGQDDDSNQQSVATSSISKLEEADRAHMIATARKYPRNITKFVNDLTELACYSQETAMEMMYSLPRAGKQLVGPSVRFAEAALACWGNARAGMEVVDVDRGAGIVTAEGRYYDCERNVGFALRKRRRIVAKKIDGDSIQVTGDAVSSIAFRDVVLRSIPKALWKPVWEKSKHTAVGQAKSMEQIRAGLVEHFTKLGVTQAQIFNSLEIQGMADIGPDEIIALNAWKKQIAEGDSTLEELFGFKEEAEADELMAKLGWNAAKIQMCKGNYKGRSSDMLAYLRSEVEKLGRNTAQAGNGAPEAAGGAAQATGRRGRGDKGQAQQDAQPETAKEAAAPADMSTAALQADAVAEDVKTTTAASAEPTAGNLWADKL